MITSLNDTMLFMFKEAIFYWKKYIPHEIA